MCRYVKLRLIFAQTWTACREAAKKDGVDYVDVCHEQVRIWHFQLQQPLKTPCSQFKVFMKCTMDHSDYYEPFLAMILGEEETEVASSD